MDEGQEPPNKRSRQQGSEPDTVPEQFECFLCPDSKRGIKMPQPRLKAHLMARHGCYSPDGNEIQCNKCEFATHSVTRLALHYSIHEMTTTTTKASEPRTLGAARYVN